MMFWRILWQLLRSSRGRLVVALLTIVSGAAVVSALVSVQLDLDRKLTQEFRTLGANVVVAPPRLPGSAASQAALMPESVLNKIRALEESSVVGAAPFLYVVARVQAGGGGQNVIVAGTLLDQVQKMDNWWKLEGKWAASGGAPSCLAGRNVARQFHIVPGSSLELRYGDRSASLRVAGVVTTGGAEDNQILIDLPVAQQLASLAGQIGLVQVSVTGEAPAVRGFVARLAAALPGEEVRPVPQLTYAEGRLLDRIRLLVLATVILILILTVLGVLATMAALAVERRRDVGLMKALGGGVSRVVQLFLTEVGILGGLGGVVGYGIGVLLSEWIGHRVFGVGISLRWEVLPLTVALMVGAALAGALPLRMLGNTRPAIILRGD